MSKVLFLPARGEARFPRVLYLPTQMDMGSFLCDYRNHGSYHTGAPAGMTYRKVGVTFSRRKHHTKPCGCDFPGGGSDFRTPLYRQGAREGQRLRHHRALISESAAKWRSNSESAAKLAIKCGKRGKMRVELGKRGKVGIQFGKRGKTCN